MNQVNSLLNEYQIYIDNINNKRIKSENNNNNGNDDMIIEFNEK